jgi:hypothetical protein
MFTLYLLRNSFQLLTHTDCSHWDEMNPDISCPIAFTDEEFKSHLKDGENWNDIADLWDAFQNLVSRDEGWTANEDYEEMVELFAKFREDAMRDMSGDELSAFEEITRWAERKPV